MKAAALSFAMASIGVPAHAQIRDAIIQSTSGDCSSNIVVVGVNSGSFTSICGLNSSLDKPMQRQELNIYFLRNPLVSEDISRFRFDAAISRIEEKVFLGEYDLAVLALLQSLILDFEGYGATVSRLQTDFPSNIEYQDAVENARTFLAQEEGYAAPLEPAPVREPPALRPVALEQFQRAAGEFLQTHSPRELRTQLRAAAIFEDVCPRSPTWTPIGRLLVDTHEPSNRPERPNAPSCPEQLELEKRKKERDISKAREMFSVATQLAKQGEPLALLHPRLLPALIQIHVIKAFYEERAGDEINASEVRQLLAAIRVTDGNTGVIAVVSHIAPTLSFLNDQRFSREILTIGDMSRDAVHRGDSLMGIPEFREVSLTAADNYDMMKGAFFAESCSPPELRALIEILLARGPQPISPMRTLVRTGKLLVANDIVQSSEADIPTSFEDAIIEELERLYVQSKPDPRLQPILERALCNAELVVAERSCLQQEALEDEDLDAEEAWTRAR